MAIQPISLPPTAITGVDAALLRPGRVEPVDASARTQTDVRALGANQAVVIQLGAQALGLARSTLSSLAATTPDSFDTDETTDASGASGGDALESLLANSVGPSETDAALLGALDLNVLRARLLTPGAFEPESGLFGYQGRSPLESGFFRAPIAPSAESFLGGEELESGIESRFPASDALDSRFPRASTNDPLDSRFPRAPTNDALESRFPGAPTNDAIESRFPRAPTNDALESRFPRALASPTESDFLFPPPTATGESGFFRAESAATESTFPATDTAEQTFPRALADAGAERATTNPRPPLGPAVPLAERDLQALERNDRQARGDERAESATAGGLADAAQLRYEIGPDGQRYIVESRVAFDVIPVPGDPAATLRKLEAISRAATSGSPSISARTSAAEADQLARQARAQLAAERYAEAQRF